jgi:hypothetical protein
MFPSGVMKGTLWDHNMTRPILMIETLPVLTANQQKLILVSAVFALYLLVIFGFAVVYYGLFRRRSLSFVFAANVAEGQLSNRISEVEESIKRLEGIDAILSKVAVELSGQADDLKIFPGKWKVKTAIGTLEYGWVTRGMAPGGVVRIATMFVAVNDNEDYSLRYQWDSDSSRFFRSASNSIGEVKSEIRNERKTISIKLIALSDTLKSFQPGSPKIWTFTDFLYFSTIIQSTVGLGDIQPNSTTVRKVVIWQIVLGYAILVVLLNITLGWQWTQ